MAQWMEPNRQLCRNGLCRRFHHGTMTILPGGLPTGKSIFKSPRQLAVKITGGFESQTFCEMVCLLECEVSIHQHQRLQSDSTGNPPIAVDRHDGGIKSG